MKARNIFGAIAFILVIIIMIVVVFNVIGLFSIAILVLQGAVIGLYAKLLLWVWSVISILAWIVILIIGSN